MDVGEPTGMDWPTCYARNAVYSVFKPLMTCDWLDSSSSLTTYMKGQGRWRGSRNWLTRGFRRLQVRVPNEMTTLRQWLLTPFQPVDVSVLKKEIVSFLQIRFEDYPNAPWRM